MFRISPKRSSVAADRFADLLPYREAVRRFFLRRVRDPHDAEDLTHDLFLRINGSAGRDPGSAPEGLIFAAAANLLKDRARHAKVVRDYVERLPVTAEDFTERRSPDRIAADRQMLQEVLAILDSFEPRVRHVFVLHRLEGWKYAEIAAHFGISVSSVEKYMMKAIARIAKYAEKVGR